MSSSGTTGPPVSMATRLCGTDSASATWTSKNATIADMQMKLHQPDGLETAEQRREFGELHRLPQRETGDHDHNADSG